MSKNSNLLYIFVIIITGLVSCSRNLTKTSPEETLVIFPLPPDTARIQFLTSISNSKDIDNDRWSFSKFVLGEEEPKVINKPYGIEIHKGKIYVCDIGIKGLEIIDLNKKIFDFFIPTGKGTLRMPVNCFVDEESYLYVADVQRKQVVIFDENRNYIESIGFNEDFKPTDVFVQGNKIWVSNNAGNRIHVFSKETFTPIDYFPKSEEGDKDFLYSPTNIFVTEDKVYVSDFGDFKIKIYTHQGNLLQTVGSYGNRLGQFVRPKGIAVDRDSNLLVVDAGFENVQIFNKSNDLLMFFGGSYKGPGYMWLPAKIIIDYDNLSYFEKYLDPEYSMRYLIMVTNQYGPDKISIYGAVEPR